MPSGPPPPATKLLQDVAKGDQEAGAQLFGLVYDDLRVLAANELRREKAAHTLQPTALVHEAYLRLVGGDGVECADRGHFLGIAARAIRRVLVDHARRRDADKRGGGAARRVTMVTALEPAGGDASALDVLALDEATTRLAARNERQARVVELRYFAGLSVAEIAALLGVSERTVKDDWRIARAWLRAELERGGP